MPELHAARRDRLRAVLATADLAGLLVTRLVNVDYLTGLTASNAALLVTPNGAVLATDARYAPVAAQRAADLELLVERRCALVLLDRATRSGVARVGFEASDVTVEQHGLLREAAAGVELVPLVRVVEALRAVKDEVELGLLRQACAISERALGGVLEGIRVGRTERDIARELENRMAEEGAEGPAFPSIVAGGAHSAVPHHRPTDRPLQPGDLLKIDFGARYAGYHADLTRTFVIGRAPAGWQVEIHDVAAAAQRAGRDALTPGVDARAVDAAARSVIAAAGYGERFPHGLGHGVGLEIHEAPLIGYDSAATLADRTPVTLEPGIYLPERGGVRIEDVVVVRDGSGGPDVLTTVSRDLLVVG